MTASNTKVVSVTPSTAGSYNLYTNTVSGISFSATGSYTAAQVGTTVNVTLQATGTPTSTGTPSFVSSGLGQTCGFTVTIISNQYYLFAKPTAMSLSMTNNDISFTSSIISNVTLSGTSITLKAGHTYRLRAAMEVDVMSSNTTTAFGFNFVNTSNTTLPNSNGGDAEANNYNNPQHRQEQATAVVTVSGIHRTLP